MDFIERWLHISPDGGNGMMEAVYVVAALTVALAFAYRRSLRRLVATRVRIARSPIPRK